jgi:hypothetical protein
MDFVRRSDGYALIVEALLGLQYEGGTIRRTFMQGNRLTAVQVVLPRESCSVHTIQLKLYELANRNSCGHIRNRFHCRF